MFSLSAYGLHSHPDHYKFSSANGKNTFLTGLSGAVYAERHFALAKKGNCFGHTLIGILEAVPLIGSLAMVIEYLFAQALPPKGSIMPVRLPAQKHVTPPPAKSFMATSADLNNDAVRLGLTPIDQTLPGSAAAPAAATASDNQASVFKEPAPPAKSTTPPGSRVVAKRLLFEATPEKPVYSSSIAALVRPEGADAASSSRSADTPIPARRPRADAFSQNLNDLLGKPPLPPGRKPVPLPTPNLEASSSTSQPRSASSPVPPAETTSGETDTLFLGKREDGRYVSSEGTRPRSSSLPPGPPPEYTSVANLDPAVPVMPVDRDGNPLNLSVIDDDAISLRASSILGGSPRRSSVSGSRPDIQMTTPRAAPRTRQPANDPVAMMATGVAQAALGFASMFVSAPKPTPKPPKKIPSIQDLTEPSGGSASTQTEPANQSTT